MAYSAKECIEKLKAAQPDLYPIWYIEDQGVYLFNLLKRGVDRNEAVSTFYAVDPRKEVIAGPIPVMHVMGNRRLTSKIEHPHMVSSEDQKPIQHELQNDSSILMHYGIKGQKWGVRRFQNIDGTLTKEGKERYSSSEKDSGEKKKKSENETESKEGAPVKTRKELRNERLRDMDKSWFDAMDQSIDEVDRSKTKEDEIDKGRVAVNVLYTLINPLNAINMAADGVTSLIAKKKTDNYLKNREEKSTLDEKTGLRIKKDGAYSEKEDLAAVNPGYMDMRTNTKNNCMLCTTTYDMRKRGYDVTAQLDSVGYNFKDLKKWYPKAKVVNNERFDENGKPLKTRDYINKTMESLLSQGDGARGNFMMMFNTGGAHSIAYEVQNGSVIFKDGQTNSVYRSGKWGGMSLYTPEMLISQSRVNSFARLDDVKPDIEMIKKECVR